MNQQNIIIINDQQFIDFDILFKTLMDIQTEQKNQVPPTIS